MSFSAIIGANTLSNFVDVLQAVVDEARFHLNEDGIHVEAVDPANVAMVNCDLKRDAFESYDAAGGEVGINLSRLDEILSMADGDDLVSLDLNEETLRLEVSFNNSRLKVATIDPDSLRSEPDQPDIDITEGVELTGGQFLRAVKTADLVSDHLTVTAADEDLQGDEVVAFRAEGDTDDAIVAYPGDYVDLLRTGPGHSAIYSMEYLNELKRPIQKESVLRLEWGDDFPCFIDWDLADGGIEVQYMLAPRIQSS